MVYLCDPGYPRTCYVAIISLEIKESNCLFLHSARDKGVCHQVWL